MKLSLGILASLPAVSVAASPFRVVERDVCIIGGGASGTYAAVRLTEEGYSVAVLEKEDHLGGQTVTYTDPDTNTTLNMGVVVFHDMPLVRGYFERLGVGFKSRVFDPVAVEPYDFSTGLEVPSYVPSSQEELGAALQTYGQIISTRYPYLSLGYDLPDPVPDELLAPFQDFVEANGIQPVVQFISGFAGGVGDLWERPTLYAIKTMSPLLLQAVSGGFIDSATGDNLDLYRGAEAYLGAENLIFNTKIRSVRRSGRGGVRVLATTPGGKVLIKAKKLVVTIPPEIKALHKIGLDLTRNERRLFSKLRGYTYGSSVITHSGTNLTGKSLKNIGADNPYFLPVLPGSFRYSGGPGTLDKISNYFAGPEGVTMSDREIKDLITAELERFSAAGNIPDGETEFKFLANHYPYHLHVSAEDVAAGFYRNLYAMEGETDTFWAGATFVDNDSALIWMWMETVLLPQIVGAFDGW